MIDCSINIVINVLKPNFVAIMQPVKNTELELCLYAGISSLSCDCEILFSRNTSRKPPMYEGNSFRNSIVIGTCFSRDLRAAQGPAAYKVDPEGADAIICREGTRGRKVQLEFMCVVTSFLGCVTDMVKMLRSM